MSGDADRTSEFRDRLHRAAALTRDHLAHLGVARWELFAKASTARSVTVVGSRTDETVEVEETGVAVRTSAAGRCGFGAASGLEVASGRRAADGAVDCAMPFDTDPLPPSRLLASSPCPPPSTPPPRGWPAHAAAELRRAVAAASGGRVEVARTTVDAGAAAWLLTTSDGFVAAHEESSIGLAVELLLDGGLRGRWREWIRVPRPESLSAEESARRMVDRVMLTTAPIRGERPIGDLLLHPEVAAHLLGALAPLFLVRPPEADPLPRLLDGAGCLAAPVLTLVDSRIGEDAPVGGPCDGEGLPARRTLLLEEGVPRHRLACWSEAAACGEPARGGAVRMSYRDAPASGISNLVVDTACGVPPGRLLTSADRLVYLLRPAAPVACDPFLDQYRLVASGVWVTGGQLDGWHPAIEIRGRLSGLLRRLEGIGSDLEWHQTAAGWVGAPSVLVGAR